MRAFLFPLAIVAFAGVAAAQVGEGQYIATVIVTPPSPAVSFGEIYVGDTTLRTVTKLTIPQKLTDDRVNAVIMTGTNTGYVSTNPNPGGGNGDIFAIILSGSTLTATQVNLTAMPGVNIAQLHLATGTPATIYFASQGGTGTGGLPGVLGKVVAGVPSIVADFALVPGATGSVNALAVSGNHAYVATFDSGSTTATPLPQVWDVDLTTTLVTKLADVPASKFNTGGAPFHGGPVNLQMDPNSATTLIVQGVYGDIYRFNVTTKALIDQRFSGPTTTATSNTNLVNSFFVDAKTGDYLEGTRDGNGDLFVLTHNGEKVYPGLGSGTTTQNSVTGIWYRPFTRGVFTAFGAGCPGQGGYTPTSFGLGTPRAGSLWGMGVASGVGSGLGLLLIGDSNTTFGSIPLPLDLAGIGRPGCNLRVSIVFTLSAPLGGTSGVAGAGLAVIPLLLPPDTRGIVAYGQWVTFDQTLIVLDAVSDGRRIGIE